MRTPQQGGQNWPHNPDIIGIPRAGAIPTVSRTPKWGTLKWMRNGQLPHRWAQSKKKNKGYAIPTAFGTKAGRTQMMTILASLGFASGEGGGEWCHNPCHMRTGGNGEKEFFGGVLCRGLYLHAHSTHGYTHTHTRTHTHMDTRTHTRTRTDTRTRTHTRTHAHARAHGHTHTHTHTHTRARMDTRTQGRNERSKDGRKAKNKISQQLEVCRTRQ